MKYTTECQDTVNHKDETQLNKTCHVHQKQTAPDLKTKYF